MIVGNESYLIIMFKLVKNLNLSNLSDAHTSGLIRKNKK